MKIRLLMLLYLSLSAHGAFADIYKCITPSGVEFTQLPCSADALNIDRADSTSKKPVVTTVPIPQIPIEKFNSLPLDADAIIEFVGEPIAKYRHRGDEHWFYPNAVSVRPSGRYSPEILLRDKLRFQIKWLPEDQMKRSLNAVLKVAGWKANKSATPKPFLVRDTSVTGMRKQQVIAALGQPDHKKVFGGNEVWEYDRVAYRYDGGSEVTIMVRFQGDIVSGVGN